MSGPTRDLVGYGRTPPQVQWPGGARLALSLVVNYEEGSERTLPEDGENEGLGEVARPVGAEHRDLATESVYEYGSRVGVHRVLRVLERYDARCTFFAAAVALERNPEVAAWVREAGHEPCSHGWRWSEEWLLSREEERERIDLAVASIARTCGERPVGWYSRWMPSVHTRELLVEEGGFLYDSNAYNDMRFVNGGVGGPADFLDYCRRAVDFLREEGQDAPRMLSIGLHPRFIGQAGRASALRDLLDYVRTAGDVWIATRREIAEWWLANQPPEGGVSPSRG